MYILTLLLCDFLLLLGILRLLVELIEFKNKGNISKAFIEGHTESTYLSVVRLEWVFHSVLFLLLLYIAYIITDIIQEQRR